MSGAVMAPRDSGIRSIARQSEARAALDNARAEEDVALDAVHRRIVFLAVVAAGTVALAGAYALLGRRGGWVLAITPSICAAPAVYAGVASLVRYARARGRRRRAQLAYEKVCREVVSAAAFDALVRAGVLRVHDGGGR